MAARLATIAEIRGLSPALSANRPGDPYPDSILESASAAAAMEIGLGPWGDDASIGHAYLTAHKATSAVAGAFGPAGPATSETTAAGATTTYASATPTGDLDSTWYGREYKRLRKIVAIRSGTMIVASTAVDNGV